ncbi:hypothetical protein K474DRAFT_1680959, partial [Panus rudis PR-1116 ss-1]
MNNTAQTTPVYTFIDRKLNVIASPNAPFPPTELDNQPPLFYLPPLQTRSPQWYDHNLQQLPLVQKYPVYTEVLRRLNINSKSVPLECVAGHWQLHRDFQLSWRSLQNGLNRLIFDLHEASKNGSAISPWFRFSRFPSPDSFGYLRSHRHRHQAATAAMKSRDTFFPLLALLSMTIWHAKKCPVILRYPDLEEQPAWVHFLVCIQGHDSGWIESLR